MGVADDHFVFVVDDAVAVLVHENHVTCHGVRLGGVGHGLFVCLVNAGGLEAPEGRNGQPDVGDGHEVSRAKHVAREDGLVQAVHRGTEVGDFVAVHGDVRIQVVGEVVLAALVSNGQFRTAVAG